MALYNKRLKKTEGENNILFLTKEEFEKIRSWFEEQNPREKDYLIQINMKKYNAIGNLTVWNADFKKEKKERAK